MHPSRETDASTLASVNGAQARINTKAQAGRKWILLRPRARIFLLFHKLGNQLCIRELLLKT